MNVDEGVSQHYRNRGYSEIVVILNRMPRECAI